MKEEHITDYDASKPDYIGFMPDTPVIAYDNQIKKSPSKDFSE